MIKKELKRINVSTGHGNTIFTGDSDFLPLVTYLRNHGKKVFVFSSRNNVSEELRTGSDGYTDILDVDGIWGKKLKHRAELDKKKENK